MYTKMARRGRSATAAATALAACIALTAVGAILAPFAELTGPVHAQGLMVPSDRDWKRDRENALISEVDQKAILSFAPGREQLLISPSYKGRARDFAWVLAVPSRPSVDIQTGAAFHDLARLAYPNGVPNSTQDEGRLGARKGSSDVDIIESGIKGAYRYTVLSSTSARALVDWLDQNDYYLPPAANKPVQEYVRKGWTFVACKIADPRSAKGLVTGTLAPLKLSFATNKPIYPLRLSAANPVEFSMLVYLLLPAEIAKGDLWEGVEVASGPVNRVGETTKARATSEPSAAGKFPTLARLTGDKRMRVYVERRTLDPNDCTDDYTWNID